MRIHIIGFVVFVIWCFFSAWLYNDYLLPSLKKPVPVITTPAEMSHEADSLMKLKASMPKDLIIFFEFNDAEFKPDTQTDQSLAAFRSWLEKYPQSMLTVTGHTDMVGTPEFNEKLGMRRALVISKYIREKGVDASRMVTESKGETLPLGDYLTEEGRAKNRRTEISIKMQ